MYDRYPYWIRFYFPALVGKKSRYFTRLIADPGLRQRQEVQRLKQAQLVRWHPMFGGVSGAAVGSVFFKTAADTNISMFLNT